MLPLLAALGMSAVKNAGDKDKEARSRYESGIQTAFSPWTGMKGQAVAPTDWASNLVQGVAGGIGAEQAAGQADQNSMLQGLYGDQMRAQIEAMKQYGNPMGGMKPTLMGGMPRNQGSTS